MALGDIIALGSSDELRITDSGNLITANVGTLTFAVISGGAAGDHTVTGISTDDVLSAVLYFAGAGTDITDVSLLNAEFSITAADTINNTGGTATTGGKLVVAYMARDLT